MMETMSETEKNSVTNADECHSASGNEPEDIVDVNLVHGTLHYSVIMTKDGNIRVKDAYCDAKDVSDFCWQNLFHDLMMLLI